MAFPLAVSQIHHCSCCVGQEEAWWEHTVREAFAKGTFLLGKFRCGLSDKAVDGKTYQVIIVEWCLGICTERFQELLLMGHLLLGKREHSTEGSLVEQHIQLPDLRVQQGYEFVLRRPHIGQPIILHVSDTAPLQVCPLAQKQGVSQWQSTKEWKNRTSASISHVLIVNPPATQPENQAETTHEHQSTSSWVLEQPLGRYSTGWMG